nr:phosphoserine phosphatase SerB [Nocardioidaceae bacterium]
ARRTRVTLLGSPLRPGAVAAVAGRVADTGANIDRIVRIARYPVTAVDLDVSGAEPHRLRVLLAQEAVRQRVDIAVQATSIHRYAQRLVVMDVDSTLVRGEVIELLAAHAGCADEVARVTKRAMQGDVDFADSLRERVALLAGLPAEVLDAVYADLVLTPGARTLVRTLRRLGYRFALVSGGFSQVIDRLAADLGIDHAAANTLEIVDGHLTGRLLGPVLDRAGKASALRRFAADTGIPVANTVAIGDGANDLDMLAAAGLGIAFNAKPVVRDQADTALSVPYLDAIAYLLGITREEIEAADAESPAGR